MEYMNDGYRKAQNLFMRMGGWIGKADWRGNYEGADKALETLLAKNIAIFAYEKPVTVTEISAVLGTSADYVEDIIDKMVETRTLAKSANKYQTTFPILDGKQMKDIQIGNLTMAKEKAAEIFDMLYSLKDDIKNLGFHGCDGPFEKLLPMLISTVSKETTGNIFTGYASNLPFQGTDKAWYLLGWTAEETSPPKTKIIRGGLNTTFYDETLDNSVEYYICNPHFEERRDQATTSVLRNLFYGSHDAEFIEKEAHNLALLIEDGKIAKSGSGYTIKVPVFDENKGEYQKLIEILSPAIELSSKLQEAVNKRSLDTVRKHLPKRLDCDEFFGLLLAHNRIEAALFELFHEKNITLTSDMIAWFVLKK